MAKNFTRRTLLKTAAIGAPSAAILGAPFIAKAADAFPSRSIVMVNPYAPGGYVDNFSRAVSAPLSKALGVPVSVVNTPGADGLLGHEYFLKQPQDGYVQLADSVNSIANSILTQHAPYKMTDFQMINLPVRDFTLMATSAKNSKLHSYEDVIKALKADPTSLKIGVVPAQSDYINLAILCDAIGVDRKKLRIVTYDDGGSVRTSVAGGVNDIGFVGALGYLPLLKKIRPLLAFASERQPPFDAPCSAEVKVGKPLDYVQGSLRGFACSASFRDKYPDRYKKIVAAYQKVFEDPAVTAMLQKAQLGTGWFGPEKSNEAFMRSYDEQKKYSYLMKGA
jgi:tripartite-type tricarboxylate transporter receptor subunit TctC